MTYPTGIALALVALVTPPSLAAQTEGGLPILSSLWRTLQNPRQSAWVRPLASAIVPGTGQLLAGQERGAIYLVLDAVFLVRFVTFQTEARRERDRYRDLAFIVARGEFAPARRDTTFEYFEQIGRFVESGAFDTDPGPALAPPTDDATYNGRIWQLARETFLADTTAVIDPGSPEYQQALAFYSSRAIGPNFRWSWRNAGLEQDLFRQTIRDSDEAFRTAARQLGLLLANHVLSAVDAFVSHRLSSDDRGEGVRLETALIPVAGATPAAVIRWRVAF